MSTTYDAIVIGAGTNGLTAAHALARAGRRVLVVERQDNLDDRADIGWVPPAVAALAGPQLAVTPSDPWLDVALPDGGRLTLWRDVARTADALRAVHPADADAWPRFATRMRAVARFLEALYTQPAPDVVPAGAGDLVRMVGLGLRARRMGREGMTDLLRLLPMSVADVLDEWFASDALKGALAAGAVQHLCQGTRSGGTAFTLLHNHVGVAPGVFRPTASNLGAVLAALPGITLRSGAEVRAVLVREARATGVALADGEEIAAPLVAANTDPRRTLLELVDADWLPPDYLEAVRHIRYRGITARMTLALEHPLTGPLAVAPSLGYLERAYDAAKYGRASAEPYVELTPANGGAEALVQYVPHTLREGPWDDARRRALGAGVVAALAAHGVGGARVERVETPADLAERHGITEGHRHHGEHTLDQILFMRPVAGWSRYRTPVRGLYLCGPGTHPGGGIPGGAGLLAARIMLEDTRR